MRPGSGISKFAVCSSLFIAFLAHAQTYDLVIRGGRVIDPESRLDAVRNVGIMQGKIRAISPNALDGRAVIDAANLVVAPGFIDLHSHGQDAENYRYKAMDGVTTALELEIGVGDVEGWYREREGKALINFGASAGHPAARMAVMHETSALLPSRDAAHRAASEEEITGMRQRLEAGLKSGAVGAGFGISYTPGASRWEILEMFRVAARFHAPCFVHIRSTGGQNVEALEEAIAATAITGAPLHVVHITSVGLRQTPNLLQIIAESRARGLDVTTEMYPYTAAMTELESAIFEGEWQKGLGISYPDIQWVETGERLTAESFARYRKQGGAVIMHMIPPEVVEGAIRNPLTMIASDGLIRKGKGHPRGSGAYARVLGYYVRETGTLPLMTAIEKMALLPARRLEGYAPAMKDKGRIRLGADADLVVFDPQRVRDRSTYENAAQYSEGMRFVLVNGTPVVKDGALVEGTPGRGIRGRAQ
jgi:N-acyl-D-aspartate/D-glutamate deacylase